MISLKSKREYSIMKEAGQILNWVHEELASLIEPGISLLELDRQAQKFMEQKKVVPAFKGYHGFPACICASVNEEVVHGIPSERKLEEGDILSLDIGVILDGFYSDAARTRPVGNVSEEAQKLIDVTRESVFRAVSLTKTGMHIGDLSNTVQSYVESHGFSVVREYVGHGIGRNLHEEPQVPNFGTAGTGLVIKEGLAIAVEPMVNVGDWRTKTLGDKWTVVTRDGKLSSHHEETMFFGAEGSPEILTK